MYIFSVKKYDTRKEMGAAAAADVAKAVKEVLERKPKCRMIFAAAPSQDDFLSVFRNDKSVPFNKIEAFHMDEYVGLKPDAPQGFGNFLRDRLFGCCPFAKVNYINGNAADIDAECLRYTKALNAEPIDIVCMGIGENGHIAFNDPGVADLHDTLTIKRAKLDLVCRTQQVHDGCFKTLNDVPEYALTLTVPRLMNAGHHFCIVPTKFKAEAVKRTIYEEISSNCPATVLRICSDATLYIDSEAASLL